MSGAGAPTLMNMDANACFTPLRLLPPLRLYGIMALRRQLVQLNRARGGAPALGRRSVGTTCLSRKTRSGS